MAEHPIEGLMKTAMESIKEMVDVNTIVGDPVETPDGSVIIPVSRVACGFAAGGGEFESGSDRNQQKQDQQQDGTSIPFGGGSGAGVSVQPVGFLVVGQGQIRLLPVDGNAMVDRLIDVAPQILSQIQGMFQRGNKKREEEKIQC
ncbi:sporulation protein YtfJ [Thermincola ferriacetica]|uniref:Sporulation protein YtfJ n=2 Tax=Thermincola TaxID=278993 RepID=D5X7B0_THEPJ|nr:MULTISPECIES: GerW family sporulation protein [Thermincola]ADG82480.1 sporulation protein YtfJ [Thermincola potens JR]KNZ70807.1 sporulation protein YtfJ [Thermincola ferriacetica]